MISVAWPSFDPTCLCQSQTVHYTTKTFLRVSPCVFLGNELYLIVSSSPPLGRLSSLETVTAFANWCENGLLVHFLMWIRSQRYRVSGHIRVISLHVWRLTKMNGLQNAVFSPVRWTFAAHLLTDTPALALDWSAVSHNTVITFLSGRFTLFSLNVLFFRLTSLAHQSQ